MLLSPNMNLDGLVILIAAIMIGPSVLLAIIGALFQKRNKKAAKVFYILAVVYLIISFGICGTLMVGA
jgi:hypothetical protein